MCTDRSTTHARLHPIMSEPLIISMCRPIRMYTPCPSVFQGVIPAPAPRLAAARSCRSHEAGVESAHASQVTIRKGIPDHRPLPLPLHFGQPFVCLKHSRVKMIRQAVRGVFRAAGVRSVSTSAVLRQELSASEASKQVCRDVYSPLIRPRAWGLSVPCAPVPPSSPAHRPVRAGVLGQVRPLPGHPG